MGRGEGVRLRPLAAQPHPCAGGGVEEERLASHEGGACQPGALRLPQVSASFSVCFFFSFSGNQSEFF